ncbi:hypothetical protein R69746_07009 [Paraburkholderia aspalathi]|uniref:hypothetical protein n=1 Tax=Paraburkholderia aspalathi TaxID=1324617 RepID=UPI00190DF606|nr:hypothetical protein [Paraburkholderia aspalathi]MBK3842999.1 hypothetical protein [Paraburkholderia aspalathi]CAE6843008.1 hypothetical protein R69746_07009 [Paraburkholderia aspalathi]
MLKIKKYLAWLLIGAGAFTALTTIAGICLNYWSVPYWDQWDGYIGFYARSIAHPWKSFFEQHNEHRLFFSRLIFWSDIHWFHGWNILSLASSVVLSACLAASFYRIATRTIAPNDPRRLAIGGLCLAMVFSWTQADNFTSAFQNQWFAVFLFALLAFDSFDRISFRTRGALIGTVAFASLSAFSTATGLLVFPLIIFFAFLCRRSRSQIAVLVLSTAIVWAAYFVDYRSIAAHGSVIGTLRHPSADLVRYFLQFLGIPVWLATHSLAATYTSAIVFLALSIAGLVQFVRQKEVTAKPLLFLCTLIVANAALTAAARLPLGLVTALSTRYATSPVLGWLAILLFLIANVRFERISWVAACIVILAFMPLQSSAPVADTGTLFSRYLGGLAIRSGVYDHQYTAGIYEDPRSLATIGEIAKRLDLSVFRNDAPGYPDAPTEAMASESCAGATTSFGATSDQGLYEAEGSIHVPIGLRTLTRIFITDATNKTIGSGILIANATRSGLSLDPRISSYRWAAFFRPTGDTYRVIGQLNDESYCALPNLQPVPKAAILSRATLPTDHFTGVRGDDAVGWKPGAVFPAANLPGVSIWGSFVDGDKTVGEVRLVAERETHDSWMLRYLTGPDATAQSIRIGMSDGSIVDLPLPGTQQRWDTLTLAPIGSVFIKSVTFVDGGSDFGQWSAVVAN